MVVEWEGDRNQRVQTDFPGAGGVALGDTPNCLTVTE